ncbi:tetratricopeptide repeat protein [Tenacibaculum agarivorans]|uniref:tetratricopeptide repeat protein n=1 Tax=Tenacibaculum agarivorans TaxID=1908389 RepID=UPI00094BC5A9|nr:tetratricopeptide repeat protein [Tenacibaculum agarivorans]
MRTLKMACVALLLVVAKGKAQEKESDCELNLSIAMYELKVNQNSEKEYTEIEALLVPCAEKDYDKAQLLLGKIYTKQEELTHHKKGFKLVKKAAKQDNRFAMVYLADLYKKGIGTEVDIKKAKKWYKKAYDLGSDKATYALGYLFYKGIGDTPQNYKRAVALFKQSSYPMAKHWLAVAYYFGNGVAQDKQKAVELLQSIERFDETAMLACMKEQMSTNFEFTELQEKLFTVENTKTPFSDTELMGNWEGSLVQLDWSEQKIIQQTPLHISFTQTEEENLKYTFSNEKNTISDIAYNDKDAFTFENLHIVLDRAFYNSASEKTIDYQITNATITKKKIEGKTYLVLALQSYAQELHELGSTFYLVLTKKKTTTENGTEVSEEVLENLQQGSDKFIKLYPNPFHKELFVAYNLTQESHIRIEATHLNTGNNQVLEEGKQQSEGEYIYYLNGDQLQQGMYVITVYVDGEKKTETIIKN